MKIVAALAWYREPPEFLDRLVRSLAGLVDVLVALDGAWALFPDAEPHSTLAEGMALHEAALDAGVRLELRTPEIVFESQVAKRAALMALAAEHGDWVLVVDADEHVSRKLPLGLRYELGRTDRVVGEVLLRNMQAGKLLGGGLSRRLYRAGTTVEIVHSGYTFEGRQLLPGEPTVDVRDLVTIEHDYANRGPERNAQAAEYLRRRTAEREEVWV